MIELNNVHFGYSGQSILRNVDLRIESGEFVAIVGENGAGKTSLVKLLNGLLQPTSGDVTIKGQNTKTTRTSMLAKSIGFLFQNPDRQLCQSTVEDEIRFGLRQLYSDTEFIERRTAETIRDFGFDKKMNPLTASRGEKQRVALAGLLALGTEILILDEPTTGLDYRECMHILSIIARENELRGTTVVMVSHDMELVHDFAKRTVILHKGCILRDGTTRQVMRDEAVLGLANLLPAQIVGVCNRLGRDFEAVDTYMQLADVVEGRSRR